jgi:hypothetical protein
VSPGADGVPSLTSFQVAPMAAYQAERGLALLRIVFGFWLLRSATTHLVWTPWPWTAEVWVQFSTTQLAQYSLEHPSFWVRFFIQQVLLPNAATYVGMLLLVKLVAGLLLTFGLLTVVGGVLALLTAAVQGVLTHYLSDLSLGYYLLQGTAALVFALTRAGRRWGLDAILAGMRSRSLWW